MKLDNSVIVNSLEYGRSVRENYWVLVVDHRTIR